MSAENTCSIVSAERSNHHPGANTNLGANGHLGGNLASQTPQTSARASRGFHQQLQGSLDVQVSHGKLVATGFDGLLPSDDSHLDASLGVVLGALLDGLRNKDAAAMVRHLHGFGQLNQAEDGADMGGAHGHAQLQVQGDEGGGQVPELVRIEKSLGGKEHGVSSGDWRRQETKRRRKVTAPEACGCSGIQSSSWGWSRGGSYSPCAPAS